ncbi:uncharacterized protein LOC112178034 [Rosa chinensis]|uniref:uncharacterized protein LOC112178034 n=1 Tax=Rosa chinensis TaxID=74649 RepID=UPI000D08EF64|nr:uncharacterized protein LOC112178034 [Rosa chinensis]
MALVQKYGRPDLFITMTCNPNWEEIKSELLPGQTSQDRPDLEVRVFHSKLEQLKEDIITKGVLGRVIAHAFVVEFHKRGLPHVHMLVMLDENDKLNNPEDYDSIVRAEISDKDEEPQLYDLVLKHMIHGLCGTLNQQSSCMKNGRCNKSYPKSFANFTVQGNNAYPIYRRRASRLPVPLRRSGDTMADNSWVVPYNPWLLLRYDCHINVEICGSIKSVKYLYKYVYKGPDRVAVQVQSDPEFDEIRQFVDARFDANETVEDSLADEHAQKSMLTEYFTMNRMDSKARRYLYQEFPQYYGWDNYSSSSDIVDISVRNRLLRDLNRMLEQFNKGNGEFDLPEMTSEPEDSLGIPRCIEDEISINIPQEDVDAIDHLNNDQLIAFNTIMAAVEGRESALFFIDGPGGTGKTYLYRALLANLRRMNHIVLATASSGIAANLLSGGRTAHSRFKIALIVDASSMCSISKQSALARLIQDSTAIIWDQAPMTHRHVFEALDRTF